MLLGLLLGSCLLIGSGLAATIRAMDDHQPPPNGLWEGDLAASDDPPITVTPEGSEEPIVMTVTAEGPTDPGISTVTPEIGEPPIVATVTPDPSEPGGQPSPAPTGNTRPTVSPTPKPTLPTATPTVPHTPSPTPGTLANISTRGWVGTGDRVMIGGFIVQGAQVKVILRGRSRSMAASGVPGLLPNPRLRLFSGQTVIAENNDWQTGNCGTEAPAGLHPTDPRESCLVATLSPGPYTAILDDPEGRTGIAIVEAFHGGGAGNFANISTRGMVRRVDEVMIGGFIVRDRPRKFVLRARSHSMVGVPDLLPNPRLRLFSGQNVIAENDDWQAGNCGSEAPAGLRPTDPRESCIAITLPPGAYTGIVDDAAGKIGNAIVEVFATD